MSQNQLKFENFVNFMKINWPVAYQHIFFLFPRMEKITGHLDNHISNLMRDEGLISSDFHLMAAIRRSKSASPFELKPSELSNYMIFSWGGLTKTMNRLEKKGIITRIDCEHDKRVRLIRLTTKGESVVEESAGKLQAFHEKLLVGFSSEEIATLDKLIEKLLDNAELEVDRPKS